MPLLREQLDDNETQLASSALAICSYHRNCVIDFIDDCTARLEFTMHRMASTEKLHDLLNVLFEHSS